MDEIATHEQVMRAGAIVDGLIEQMVNQELPAIAIASALLGGALNVLSANLPDEAILRILHSAIDSVESGDLRAAGEPPQ